MNGFSGQVCLQSWPEYDESKTVAATAKMAVQVGGKVKANIVVDANASDEEVVSAALAEPKIVKLAEGMQLVKGRPVRSPGRPPPPLSASRSGSTPGPGIFCSPGRTHRTRWQSSQSRFPMLSPTPSVPATA